MADTKTRRNNHWKVQCPSHGASGKKGQKQENNNFQNCPSGVDIILNHELNVGAAFI